MIKEIASRLKGVARVLRFGDYYATQDKGRRTSPKSRTASEDGATTTGDRGKIVATTRQQRRNIELVQWIANCHLSSVAKFTFQAHTGNKDLDKRLERLVQVQSKAQNFSLDRRFDRQQFVYFLEAGRFIDGDLFPAFTNTGRVQGIEGDRIRTPIQGNTKQYSTVVDGVAKNPDTGEHLAYAVHQRKGSSFEFQQWNPIGTTRQVAYTKRFDQDRGISPLVTSVNRIQDLYEGMDAMAIKTKFHAMFGIAIEKADMTGEDDFEIVDASTGTAATSSSSKDDLQFKIEPGLRMQTDGQVNTIESKSPHPGYMDWSMLCVHVSLLAADIPFSFFDSRKSSYNARYADTQRYYAMAEDKRVPLILFQNDWFIWQLALELVSGRLDLTQYPDEKTGAILTLDDFTNYTAELVEWVPAGIPFLDPKQEIEAGIMAIAAGLDSQQAWCKRHGRDADSILDQLESFQNDVRDRGVTLYLGKPGQEELFPPEEEDPEDGLDTDNDNDDEDDDNEE